ncbi:MAG: hypothetical protein K0S20_660, partial [Patescibacteria group bacterium]|nr:hypothetical protein [Patescibacteria group bacterium]
MKILSHSYLRSLSTFSIVGGAFFLLGFLSLPGISVAATGTVSVNAQVLLSPEFSDSVRKQSIVEAEALSDGFFAIKAKAVGGVGEALPHHLLRITVENTAKETVSVYEAVSNIDGVAEVVHQTPEILENPLHVSVVDHTYEPVLLAFEDTAELLPEVPFTDSVPAPTVPKNVPISLDENDDKYLVASPQFGIIKI